jgi:hypothetical protein
MSHRPAYRQPAPPRGLIGPTGGPGHQGSDDAPTDAEAAVILRDRPGTRALIRDLLTRADVASDPRRARGLVQEAEAWARTLEVRK